MMTIMTTIGYGALQPERSGHPSYPKAFYRPAFSVPHLPSPCSPPPPHAYLSGCPP